MSSNPELQVVEMLAASGALLRGHFRLSSGLHSPNYVQCALLLEEPSRASSLGGALAAEFVSEEPQSVLSPALGGLIIGYEVARAGKIPFRFCERQGGEMVLRRGFELHPGERVLVIEDVVTTGGSAAEAVTLAEDCGARVVGVGALLDRSGPEVVWNSPFRSLHRLALQTYEESSCPLCQAKMPLSEPGSRRSARS